MNYISLMIPLLSFLLIVVLSIVGLMLQNRTSFGREKSSSYECGLDPNMSARIPFSLRLLLLAVILLVFDVEIALLMGVPISLSFNYSSSVISSSFFIIILIGGLFHEWREGSLNWM